MKRKEFIIRAAAGTLACLVGGSAALSAAEKLAPAGEDAGASKRALVVFYSWSGNTKALAGKIRAATGAEIFELVPEKPYPKEYRKCTEQAKKEIAENFRPALKATPANLAEFDVVFVGSPNWWGTFAPPVSTFLDAPELAGKTLVPFFTHGGGGMQRCESDVRARLEGRARVLKALTLSGSSADGSRADRAVAEWLKALKVEG